MSRFVSGGTVDEPVERDDAWLKAQEEIEAKRRQKEDQARQEGGKSLYEVLQANKAAKQDAFEESIRLKNQFRSLDQDEVEFLDSVLESTRAKEDAVRKETAEQLEAFRRQQEDTEKAALQDNDNPDVAAAAEKGDTWSFNARKRKRGREREGIAGLKLRKSSSTATVTTTTEEQRPHSPAPTPVATTNNLDAKSVAPSASAIEKAVMAEKTIEETADAKKQSPAASASASPKPAVALGLGAYSSDED